MIINELFHKGIYTAVIGGNFLLSLENDVSISLW
jgi:hypothetical protein